MHLPAADDTSKAVTAFPRNLLMGYFLYDVRKTYDSVLISLIDLLPACHIDHDVQTDSESHVLHMSVR